MADLESVSSKLDVVLLRLGSIAQQQDAMFAAIADVKAGLEILREDHNTTKGRVAALEAANKRVEASMAFSFWFRVAVIALLSVGLAIAAAIAYRVLT